MLIRNVDQENKLKSMISINDIAVYRQEVKGYERWIICCDIKDRDKLEEVWDDIAECVAIDIQAGIEDMISRMNIYLLFFVNDFDDGMLKSKIENNKFSSRKIIIPFQIPTGDNLKKYIERRLFEINVDYDYQTVEKSLYDYFSELDSNLFSLYSFGEKDYEKVLNYFLIGVEKNE